MAFNPLLYPILIPAAAGVVTLIIPRGMNLLRGLLALIAAGIMGYYAYAVFALEGAQSWSHPWARVAGMELDLALRADSLSKFIILAACGFTVLIILYSLAYMQGRPRLREYYTYILWVAAAANAALMADNLLLLLVSWEIVTLLLFLLITIGGGKARNGAGKTFVMIGASDCALLMGIVVAAQLYGTITISGFDAIPVAGAAGVSVYLLLLVGALTKAGAMPFHTWLPKAAEGAPVSVMAFLPAALDKLLGIYLLARLSLYMFTISGALQMLLLVIGAATVILAVMAALVQHDLKKLLSFHAVSQVGYMVLGIGTGIPVGIAGGLFHMLNNAIYKCCLFLGAGAVEKQAGTTEMEKLGGLAKVMPVTFFSMLIAALAISGVPPFNGFASKWMIYQGLLQMDYAGAIFLLAALFGSALTMASFVKVIYSVFLGQRPTELKAAKAVSWAAKFPMMVLALACIAIGIFASQVVSYLISPAVDAAPALAGKVQFGLALWTPGLATILIIIGIVFGLLIYLFTRGFKVRETSVFVGGEIFGSEDLRMPGTGFYETVRNAKYLQPLYRDSEAGAFDLYVLGGRYGSKIVEMLRALHDGALSTYLTFCLVGLLLLMLILIGI